MLVARVVRDDVEQDADPALPRLLDQPLERRHVAEVGVDVAVVRDVVAPVLVRGRVDRVQPEPGDAEPLEVLELAADPLEVTDAVAVGIRV
jgi:hypothetical protein